MSSREDFESSQGKNLDFDRYPSGEYCDIEAQSAWEAWQAATERAEEVCQDEMDNQFIDSDAWHAARSCRDAIREGASYARLAEPTPKAVRLTHADIAKALASAGLMPEDYREDGEILPLVIAIESATLRKNGIEVAE